MGVSGQNLTGMRVVVAPDTFKGTLPAPAVADALAAGWRRVDPGAEVHALPVADGGEGTLDVLVGAHGGGTTRVRVTGPLGDPVDAAFGRVPTDRGLVAIVEMARASGLELVHEDRRDVRRATTYGTGELIRAACSERPERLVVCVGGSATNDAGAGAAQAVGVRLRDERGHDLPPGGAELRRLAAIDLSGLERSVRETDVVVAADVLNPLLGPRGASSVYGPQKGARPADVRGMEEALAHFAAVVNRDLGIDIRNFPGGGAAGGLAAGLFALLGARIRPGFDVVAEALGLGEELEAADVAVTGEGRWDAQSLEGKAPARVLRLAREAACRTVLVAGEIAADTAGLADLSYSLVGWRGRHAAIERTAALLEEVGERAARALGKA